MMMPPHAGEKCCSLIKFLEKNLQKKLPTNIPTRIVYTVLSYHLTLKTSKFPHHLKKTVVLKTVIRITSVKVHDG